MKVLEGDNSPDATDCEVAVAAAAVVSASCRAPLPKLPDEAREWVIATGFVPSLALTALAASALTRVSTDSELVELWGEAGEVRQIRKALGSLVSQLESVTVDSLPERAPKPPPTPRMLSKLIERVRPGERGRRRLTLQEKLRALSDVNAPLPGTFRTPPLCAVAKAGLKEEVCLLLDAGADPNLASGVGYAPLLQAASNGHAGTADLLLSRGARLFNTLMVKQSSDGSLAPTQHDDPAAKPFDYAIGLFAAASRGFIDVIQVLVQHGASLHQRDLNGDTLLHKAAEGTASLDAIDFLVAQGVDPLATKTNNESVLHYAVRAGRLEPVRRFLDLGVNPNLVVRHDGTALDITEDPEIARILQERGGKLERDL
jgi:ankyrin repeat protein